MNNNYYKDEYSLYVALLKNGPAARAPSMAPVIVIIIIIIWYNMIHTRQGLPSLGHSF